MTPDIKVKDFYLQFIHKCREDIKDSNKNLSNIIAYKKELWDSLNTNKEIIYKTYKIDLDKYSEFTDKHYNPKESLHKQAIDILRDTTNDELRMHIITISKYCSLLKKEFEINNIKEIALERVKIKYKEYVNILGEYYTKVQECVLKGMGYKYNGGIGVYVIHHWNIPKEEANLTLDYAATNANKKEIIKKGLKPYDDKEAAWYEARHIPYDGVKYKIYRQDTDWYEFTFMQSSIFKRKELDYKRTEYVAAKYRGMSYKDIADKFCGTIEDIYKLQVDIKYKLNMILYKDPNKYLNYVRNPEQDRKKYRKYNRKNR